MSSRVFEHLLSYITKCSQLILVPSLPELWNQPFLQGSQLPFNGQQILETKIWALDMLTPSRVVVQTFSAELENFLYYFRNTSNSNSVTQVFLCLSACHFFFFCKKSLFFHSKNLCSQHHHIYSIAQSSGTHNIVSALLHTFPCEEQTEGVQNLTSIPQAQGVYSK